MESRLKTKALWPTSSSANAGFHERANVLAKVVEHQTVESRLTHPHLSWIKMLLLIQTVEECGAFVVGKLEGEKKRPDFDRDSILEGALAFLSYPNSIKMRIAGVYVVYDFKPLVWRHCRWFRDQYKGGTA